MYVQGGFDVKIDCNAVNGSLPITIQWLRNGLHYQTMQRVVSTVTITDANNGDVFTCKATNILGSDTEDSTIYVQHCKWHVIYHMYIVKCS